MGRERNKETVEQIKRSENSHYEFLFVFLFYAEMLTHNREEENKQGH
jgi:hypothetical protein